MPQCSYTAHLANGMRVVAVANVDTAPQPYFRLDRAATEAGQAFTSGKLRHRHLRPSQDWAS